MRGAWVNGLLVLASLACGAGLLEAGVWLYEAAGKSGDIAARNFKGRDRIDLAALNYNDGTVPTRRPDGQFRVLGFGDSFAYAITRYPYSYHGVAAAGLSGRLGRDVRIVNLGEPAVSFHQYIKGYDVWGEVLEHDGVIFNTFIGNDLLDIARFGISADLPLHRIFGPSEMDMETGRPRRIRPPHKFPLRFLDYAYMSALSVSGGGGPHRRPTDGDHYNFAVSPLGRAEWLGVLRTQLDNFAPDKVDDLAEGYRAFAGLVHRASQARMAGKKVMILLSPNQAQVEDEAYRESARAAGRSPEDYDRDLPAFLMAALAREIDPEVPLVDPRPALRCAAARGVRTYYRTDTHWSEDGNRIVGEVLAAAMARLWFQTEAAPSPGDADCVAAARLGEPPPQAAGRLAALATLKAATAAGSAPVARPLPPVGARGRWVTIDGQEYGLTADIAGWVEFATENEGGYRIAGWAYDRADPRTPVGVATFSRGAQVMARRAAIGRPDVSAAANTKVASPGFDFKVEKADLRGPVRFFAYVPGQGVAAELPCNPERCEVPGPR